MGVNASVMQWLLACKRTGCSFADTATLGKQAFLCHPTGFNRIIRAFGLTGDTKSLLAEYKADGDAFFSLLGSQTVTSFDISAFEDADVLHDMNTPIEARFCNRYSVVLDGGSLEHVFNVMQAFKNCLDMVAVGGHFISISVANNAMGHGFYQFSPELYFRILTPENGFSTPSVLLCVDDEIAPIFYAVDDPAHLGHRIELISDRQVYIMAMAEKTACVPVFATFPYQSDYAAAWQDEHQSKRPARKETDDLSHEKNRPRWGHRLPGPLKSILRPFYLRYLGHPEGFYQPFFNRLALSDMAEGRLH